MYNTVIRFTVCCSQHDAQMDYFGKRLATCSSDKTVRIFEVSGDQQTLVATLSGLVAIVTS